MGAPLAHTIPSAAAELGCSKGFIYKLLANGELASVKLGRSRRVLHDDLVAYLSTRRVESVRRLVEQAVEQGHPEHIADPATIANVAAMVLGGGTDATAP